MNSLYDAATKFVGWLEEQVVGSARGDRCTRMTHQPRGRFWLGRLAPEESVLARQLGERGERLDPCALGLTVRPLSAGPWNFIVTARAAVWGREAAGDWIKSEPIQVVIPIQLPQVAAGEFSFGRQALSASLNQAFGVSVLAAEIRVEVELGGDGAPEITLLLVNDSAEKADEPVDTILYECSLAVEDLATRPFQLAALPDSFRYDRDVLAYGVNGGVELGPKGELRTTDCAVADRQRPAYWNVADTAPDLRFTTLAQDPMPSLEALVDALTRWGASAWGKAELDARAQREGWTAAMRSEADQAAADFGVERDRVRAGLERLRLDPQLEAAFQGMNRAMAHAAAGKYDGWRPFQVGFLLANLDAIAGEADSSDVADILWFATGGGKTETYLGVLVTAMLYERAHGKIDGISAWTRFPLRMLSLQQTQRFADAVAGAELARRAMGLPGEPLSVGYFVGQEATPNRISADPKEFEPDPYDVEMPKRYQVLLRCPFCRHESLDMAFDRRRWRLQHQCPNSECPWPEAGLPFYVVDEEIYRFLPTVIVGTLDKAASIGLQAAMVGLVGPPGGLCSSSDHGYVYAPRSTRPNGCLVPGCRGKRQPLPMAPERYAPSFRLQDELHLLRDSLGAVDAHYESILDHLQTELGADRPKIVGSSATLAGVEKQVGILYRRSGRVFPQLGPTAERGFWTADTNRLARRYVGLAPRGQTLEYVLGRITTDLQAAIRRLVQDPAAVCREVGVDPAHAPDLISIYGVNVLYGNTIRDIEAATRSMETQVVVTPPVKVCQLTGRTRFEEIRTTLQRLDRPEKNFADRLHVVTASSMMSHGVDVDRLNAMVMMGLPLTSAEFIQASARVGRTWPGVVFVLHKIARERDAGTYRSFESFVLQGDRFVESIPITRRSRKVLDRTLAGAFLARLWAIHEPRSGSSLTSLGRLHRYFGTGALDPAEEVRVLRQALGLNGPLEAPLAEQLEFWIREYFENLRLGKAGARRPMDLSPTGDPMRSLRDVEEQAPVYGRDLP